MSNWPSVSIADLAAVKGLVGGPFGSSLVSADYVQSGVPVIRGVNLSTNGRFNANAFVFVSADKVQRDLARNLAIPGDVIFTQRGTLGQVGIVPDGLYDRYVVSQSQMRLRVDRNRTTPEFVYYAFRSREMIDAINNHAITTGVPHTNLAILGALSIRLAPMKEQRAITDMLGALDDKIAVNESGIQTAQELMRLTYRLSITQGSTTLTVDEIAAVFDGPHATPEKTASGAWFLSISSLQAGRLVLTESAHLGEHDFGRWTRRVTPTAGDVLFSYETRLGEAALMPADVRACLGRRMALLRPRAHTVGPRTLLQAFLSESFQETIRQRSVHGATVDRIPLTELPAWPIMLPERADRLEVQLGALDDMATQRERENETLAALRDALLPKLMSGEIRVRGAEKVVEEAL